MYNINKKSFNEFLEKVSENVGFKIDKTSFDYDILKSLFNTNNQFNEEYEKILNSIVFENMKGEDLDNFLSFFNLFRKRSSNKNLYNLVLIFKAINNSVVIKENCIINIGNESYRNVKTVSIENEKEYVTVQKINKTDITQQIAGNNGSIIFDENNLAIAKGELKNEGQKILLLGIQENKEEIESDFEFLERSKSVLQSFGYDNIEKIKFEILKDKRIKGIKILEKDNVTEIIVFPHNLNVIDEIINYNKHVVDYYKASIVELIRPNLFSLNAFGIKEQIENVPFYEEHIKDIENNFKLYLNTLLVQDNKIEIKTSDLIDELKRFLKNKPNIILDYSFVTFEYDFYYRSNYNSPVFSKTIKDKLDILNDNVVTFGKVI